MPTIRITEKTWKDLNRIAREFVDLGIPEFENVLKISPDITINKLMTYWDEMEKEDTALFERTNAGLDTSRITERIHKRIMPDDTDEKKQKTKGKVD